MLDEIPYFGVEGQTFELPALLVDLYERKHNDGLLCDLVWGWAWAIDDSVPQTDWIDNPLEIIGPLCEMRENGGPLDTDVAYAIRACPVGPRQSISFWQKRL